MLGAATFILSLGFHYFEPTNTSQLLMLANSNDLGKVQGTYRSYESMAGLVGFPAQPPYVTSKHGVVGLTRTAALDYGSRGIRVNAVCPGVIHTTMVESLLDIIPDVIDSLNKQAPVGRIGQPGEIAEAIVWLCSDTASFVTGHALAVDGGYVIQ